MKLLAKESFHPSPEQVTQLNELGVVTKNCIRATSAFYMKNFEFHQNRLETQCGDSLASKRCLELADAFQKAGEQVVEAISQMSGSMLTVAEIFPVINEKWWLSQ